MTARFCRILSAMLVLVSVAAIAQSGNQSRLASDFMREGQALQPCKKFSFGNLVDCGQTLATGQPLHIAFGNLAPQNGFGLGLAFVEHTDFVNEWRTTYNADAVVTPNGSWRAGAYLKAFRLGGGNIVPVYSNTPIKKSPSFFHVAPLFNVYFQSTSLNRIDYYGLGPNTAPSNQTVFGMTQTIAGTSAIVPLGHAGLSLHAELNGRIPRLRGNHGESVPSIEQSYSEATAPGLSRQPSFIQTGVGVRIQPSLFQDHLRLHYDVGFQSFAALSDSHYSFRRWTADLGHEFPLDRKVHLTTASDQSGPDSCSPQPMAKCPSPLHVSNTLDHEGSIGLRLLMTGSLAGAGSVVPFYFDPTVGGSDLNSQAVLASFPDYRFRAPNLILLRGTVEHAIPRVPLGAYFSVDAAKSGLYRGDINFSNLRESYTAGLTVHAGGLPVIYLLFAWGGGEGHHTIFHVSDTLLGGSARPSLF